MHTYLGYPVRPALVSLHRFAASTSQFSPSYNIQNFAGISVKKPCLRVSFLVDYRVFYARQSLSSEHPQSSLDTCPSAISPLHYLSINHHHFHLPQNPAMRNSTATPPADGSGMKKPKSNRNTNASTSPSSSSSRLKVSVLKDAFP